MEKSAANGSKTTIHSGLGVTPGSKLVGLNEKNPNRVLRNNLFVMKSLIVDERSRVSSDLWTDIELNVRRSIYDGF